VADFNTKFLNAFRFPRPEKGKLYAIPLIFEIYLIFYREDLMTKKGADPKSLKSLEDWINILPSLYFRDQKSGEVTIYPAVIRGGGTTDIIDPLNSLVLNYWGEKSYDFEKFVYFNEAWKPKFNDPSIVKAFKIWATIMKFGPKDVTNFSWYDAFRLFIENKAVTWWYDAHILAYYFKNKQSVISNKIGYALPEVDHYKNSCFWCWGVGIPENISDNDKKAAWIFIEWFTGKEISEKIAKKVYSSTRNSILKSKSFKYSLPKQLNKIIYSVLDKMQPSAVYMEDFDPIILLIRDTIHKIYAGSELNESISWLQQKVEELKSKFAKDYSANNI
jgi:multiple sugar transport system substrate-binding protein